MTRTLVVTVKPNARASALLQQEDGTWRASLKSPPVDGKANAELIGLIAEHFACRRAAITIKSGASSAIKRIVIEGL
jgi:uncharacterized protein YggU (UPF0235/DUF167 family)